MHGGGVACLLYVVYEWQAGVCYAGGLLTQRWRDVVSGGTSRFIPSPDTICLEPGQLKETVHLHLIHQTVELAIHELILHCTPPLHTAFIVTPLSLYGSFL